MNAVHNSFRFDKISRPSRPRRQFKRPLLNSLGGKDLLHQLLVSGHKLLNKLRIFLNQLCGFVDQALGVPSTGENTF
jgi:hypothetical protein